MVAHQYFDVPLDRTAQAAPTAGNVGVGFAIPINQVKQVLSYLEGGLNV